MSQDLLDRSSRRIETLLDRFGAFPVTTGARADAEELVRTVSALYGQCLRHVVQTLHEKLGERADRLVEECCDDPLVASLLITHGLHPVPLRARVERAIEALRPQLREQNADVELTGVDEEVVSIRLNGMADVVPLVERAIHAAAPEVLEVRCAGQTISLLTAV